MPRPSVMRPSFFGVTAMLLSAANSARFLYASMTVPLGGLRLEGRRALEEAHQRRDDELVNRGGALVAGPALHPLPHRDPESTPLDSSHKQISYFVFCFAN